MHEFGRWDSFLFGSFHAICHLLTLTAPSYRGSPPIQETNLDPFFTHLQYCGRSESETDKAKLPWQRHIVPIHSQQQVGWIPRLIRYFIPWAINHFVLMMVPSKFREHNWVGLRVLPQAMPMGSKQSC